MNKKKLATYIILIIIFSFLVNSIFQSWEEIRTTLSNFNPINLILIFIVISTLHFLNSLSWHLITKSLDFKISFKQNLRIWLLPNISRYIPGVVWQYLGRIYLLSKQNVTKKESLLAVAMDAIFTFGIGALVVILTFTFQWILLGIILIPLGIIVVFKNQNLIRLMLLILKKVTKKDLSINHTKFQAEWLIFSSFVTFSQFIVAGFSLFIISNSFHPLPINLIPTFAGIYAGSWILGYISFFAPGGLGIQELSIAGLLSAFMPLPLASLTAIIFRFTLTLSEVLISSVAFLTRDKS